MNLSQRKAYSKCSDSWKMTCAFYHILALHRDCVEVRGCFVRLVFASRIPDSGQDYGYLRRSASMWVEHDVSMRDRTKQNDVLFRPMNCQVSKDSSLVLYNAENCGHTAVGTPCCNVHGFDDETPFASFTSSNRPGCHDIRRGTHYKARHVAQVYRL